MSRVMLGRVGAWATVKIVAETLQGVSRVAPLKGALLDATVLPGRAARTVDVDLLVEPGAFHDAHRRLVQAGFRWLATDRDDRARTYAGMAPRTVDLHRSLFKRGLYRMDVGEVWERTTLDESLFDFPVQRLDPRDAYAHAVGHAASGAATPLGVAHADLRALAPTVSARAVATHLVTLGLSRAARFVLDADDPFMSAVLSRLPPDPMGARLVSLARRGWGDDKPRLARAASAHLLNDTIPRGARSLASHLLRGVRQRMQQRLGRTPYAR